MENASKALLIAAAVLVVILVITFGIRIFSSSSDTQDVALKTGETLTEKTQIAKGIASAQISGRVPATENNIKEQILSAYQEYKNSSNVSGNMQTKLRELFDDKSLTVTDKNDKIIVSSNVNGETKKYVYDKNTNSVSEYVNTINYGNKTKDTIAPGDDITIETEVFKVFSVNNGTIKAMPYYNLVLNSNPIKQATKENANNAGGSAFSTTNYWPQGEDAIDMSDSRNLIQKYIVAYKKTLEDLGAEGIQVRVARYSELNAKGITNEMRNPSKSTWFWVGSGMGYGGHTTVLWYIDRNGGNTSGVSYGGGAGVRPIIIIE